MQTQPWWCDSKKSSLHGCMFVVRLRGYNKLYYYHLCRT